MYCSCGNIVENRDTGLCASCGAERRKQDRAKAKEVKPVKKVSTKRAAQNREYARLRKEYLEAYPCCEVPECHRKSVEIHHERGRQNDLLTDVNYFMAVCAEHHHMIHANPEWARKNGYSILRSV